MVYEKSGYDNLRDWKHRKKKEKEYNKSRRKEHQVGKKINTKLIFKGCSIQFKDGNNEHKTNKADVIMFRLKDQDFKGQDEMKIWIKLENGWEEIERQVVKRLKEVSLYIDYDKFKGVKFL